MQNCCNNAVFFLKITRRKNLKLPEQKSENYELAYIKNKLRSINEVNQAYGCSGSFVPVLIQFHCSCADSFTRYFLPRDATQSAVMPQYVVRLSVRPSVRP